MEMNFLNVNVRHENKSNSLILLYYDVLLMMFFMKVKSFKSVKNFLQVILCCSNEVISSTKILSTHLMSEQKLKIIH